MALLLPDILTGKETGPGSESLCSRLHASCTLLTLSIMVSCLLLHEPPVPHAVHFYLIYSHTNLQKQISKYNTHTRCGTPSTSDTPVQAQISVSPKNFVKSSCALTEPDNPN